MRRVRTSSLCFIRSSELEYSNFRDQGLTLLLLFKSSITGRVGRELDQRLYRGPEPEHGVAVRAAVAVHRPEESGEFAYFVVQS